VSTRSSIGYEELHDEHGSFEAVHVFRDCCDSDGSVYLEIETAPKEGERIGQLVRFKMTERIWGAVCKIVLEDRS
jgi:hypothetical protein